MITALKLKEAQLDELYDWIDGLPMSRPKKYIAFDKIGTLVGIFQMEFLWRKSFIISTLKSSKCTTTLPVTPTKSNFPIGKHSKVSHLIN